MSDAPSAHAHAGSNGHPLATGIGYAVLAVIGLIGAFIFLPAFGTATMDILHRMSGTAPVAQQVQVQPLSYSTTAVAPSSPISVGSPPQQIQGNDGRTYNFQGIEETHDQRPCTPGETHQMQDGSIRVCLGQR